MKKTKILLVDDHEIVRLGLMTLINDQPDLQVVGEAGSAEEALRQVEQLQPEVILMDIRLPGESGIYATKEITSRHPGIHIVMLTSYLDEALIVRAIRSGASGYILKQVGNEELLRALRAAARGEAMLDPSTTARLLTRVREVEHKVEMDAFRDLSEREMDVLMEITRGRTNAEIGELLHLSDKTVRNYITTILDKLDLSNRVELATYATEHHIFDNWERNQPL